MPIDRKRYEQFQKELQELYGRLTFDEYYAVVRAKLLDYLARNAADPADTAALHQLVRQVFGPAFEPYTERVFAAYRETLDVVNERYKDLGVDVTKDFQKIRAIELANAAELGDFEDEAVRHITKSVRDSVLANETSEQLRRRLGQAGGPVRTYARAIAQTQVKVIARAAKTEKARIAEVEFYEYVGLFRLTNRPFCRALLGTTHHVDTINQMRNGNKEPVLINCGGWRCIHDWEPDPFAKEATAGKMYQVGGTVFFADKDGPKRFSQANTEQHYKDLADPKAFVARCKAVPLAEARIKHIRAGHKKEFRSDFEAVAAAEYVRAKPDATYYQFHEGRSTTIFERGGRFLFATEREVKTLYTPKDRAKFEENAVRYWKRIEP